jgi:methyl-accepting chemotaxis protein
MAEEKPRFALKIFHKILLTMLAVAFIPLGGLLYISGYQLEQDWRRNVHLNLALTAEGLVGKVNGWADMNLRALREAALLPAIASMNPTQQKPVLKAIQSTYEWAYLVFTTNREGQNISRSDDNPPQSYGDRNYFKQVLEGKPIGQEVVIGRTTQKPALILAGPIRATPASGATDLPLAGIMAMAMHLVDVSTAVTGARIGQTGFAILVDQDNKIIAHGKPERVAQALQDFSAHPALQARDAAGEPIFYEEEGRRIVAHAQKTRLGWTLVIQQNYDEAFAPLLEARRNSWLLIALSLVLMLGVAYALSRQLASPIWELTTVAETISRGGGFGQKIAGTERRDEIGALARAIERMAVSIKIAFERLRRKP